MNILWLLAPLLALLDRLAGGWPKVPGRGVWYGVPILLGFLWYATGNGWLAAAVAAAFYLWRDCPPKQFGGELDKANVGTFLKHCLVLPIMLSAPHPLWLLPFPFIATALAPLAARHNTVAELTRGAVLGACLCLSLL